jgi:hypothetical protein
VQGNLRGMNTIPKPAGNKREKTTQTKKQKTFKLKAAYGIKSHFVEMWFFLAHQ